MAFNFNWSPLTADAEFYSKARDLLTKALNKSPKPPIIVDDILVDELNLGHVPPDLEILEIGDLAEDRFRGIFKMCYSGDAYLTLKTRVQVRQKIFLLPFLSLFFFLSLHDGYPNCVLTRVSHLPLPLELAGPSPENPIWDGVPVMPESPYSSHPTSVTRAFYTAFGRGQREDIPF